MRFPLKCAKQLSDPFTSPYKPCTANHWCFQMGSDGEMTSINDSRGMSLFSKQQAASSIVVMTGLTHNHYHHSTWTRCSMTHLMMKHPPWLVDGNKCCDNRVETRDVHCALMSLSCSLRTNTECRECEQSGMDEGETNAF